MQFFYKKYIKIIIFSPNYMYEMLIGGTDVTRVQNNASRILKVTPLFIALIFVIISLGTMPGTIGHKTKYVKKDDPNHELALKDISIPVSLLSFTLLLIIGGIVLNMEAVKNILQRKP